MEKIVQIHSEFITLGQFLKYADIISSGGMTKIFLAESVVKVNGELENRRGKKLYNNDVVSIDGYGIYKIVHGG